MASKALRATIGLLLYKNLRNCLVPADKTIQDSILREALRERRQDMWQIQRQGGEHG